MVTKMLELARGELGTVETAPGEVKYNTAYYNRKVSGKKYAWCAVFIWWLFRQAGISKLYFDGKKTAYVPALYDWGRKKKLLVDAPQPGDLVIFDFTGKGRAQHVGLCESVGQTTVTTIDGNTGGGKVLRQNRNKSCILAVIRPAYPKQESVTMTQEAFDKYMENWLQRQGEKKPGEKEQVEGLAKAKAVGITDGTRPMALCTRLEAAMMAAAAMERRE